MRTAVSCVMALAVAGCTDSAQFVIEPGQLIYFEQGARISMPDGARVGDGIDVSVTTYGNGCVEHYSTEVDLAGDTVEVAPFDVRDLGSSICTTELAGIQHSVTLRFETPGAKLVRVHGRQVTEAGDVEMVIERSILLSL